MNRLFRPILLAGFAVAASGAPSLAHAGSEAENSCQSVSYSLPGGEKRNIIFRTPPTGQTTDTNIATSIAENALKNEPTDTPENHDNLVKSLIPVVLKFDQVDYHSLTAVECPKGVKLPLFSLEATDPQ